MNDAVFNLRKVANQDLEKFETYINYLNNHGNGLIVFSQQRLFSLNSTIFTPSLYSFDNLKTIMDLNSNFSIEEVFEPSVFSKNTQRDETSDDFSTGAFDRLLELLAIGQDFVFSIDNEFLKMTE